MGVPAEHMPPVLEGLEDLVRLAEQGWRFWIATDGEAIVGTVRGREVEAVVEIGRLGIASGYQRRGIATALMAALEAGFPEARAFELFTGHNAYPPLALYDKLGYRHTRDELLPSGYRLVWLEKATRTEESG